MAGKLSQHILAAAAQCRHVLTGGSFDMVRHFIMSQHLNDGGFKGRSAHSDLYYTLFGLDCMQVLGIEFQNDKVIRYLDQFRDFSTLDYIHLCCLARCLAKLPKEYQDSNLNERIVKRLQDYQAEDGCFRMDLDASHTSIYATLLGVMASEDLNAELAYSDSIKRSFMPFKTADKAYADQPGVAQGTTTVTAAAVTMLHQFGESNEPTTIRWLLAQQKQHGGFRATPDTPMPDLLSTASALVALHLTRNLRGVNTDSANSYVEDLWDESGGFSGHILDTSADCEYTFYALLSLGILNGNER